MTRQAYALDRIDAAAVPRRNRRRGGRRRRTTRRRCRTSGCGTGARCRTRCGRSRRSAPTTTFPTSTSIATRSTATVRQMMLAARELNIERLPESSRNWINEKLIYTHGYGVTMNPVNGFTPEGLPTLILSNMPVQSTIPVDQGDAARDLLRRADQHRRLREDAPEGIQLSAGRDQQPDVVRGHRRHRRSAASSAGCSSRSTAATSTKLPFSDDVTRGKPAADAPQHPRARRQRSRRSSPSIPIPTSSSATTAGCSWMMDGFTTSDTLPLRAALPARARAASTTCATASRRSSTPTTARRRSTSSTPTIRSSPPIARSSRACSRTRRRCRRTCASTCAIPELLLQLQAAVYGLYHMTDPEVFYNREDLWTVASRGRP